MTSEFNSNDKDKDKSGLYFTQQQQVQQFNDYTLTAPHKQRTDWSLFLFFSIYFITK